MEYKCKDGMIDNRMVKDDHQQGIARVMQRKGDTTRADKEGHKGSMAGGWKHGGGKMESHWKRSGDSLTPRKA
jgi:hypothetical protein